MVPYVPLVERSEPLSSFERLMVNKLDFISVTQKEHYERAEARFEHLDKQIEATQEQLLILYHRDDQFLFLLILVSPFFFSIC